MNDLSKKIEAILFWRGESISRKKLADILGTQILEINQAIEIFKKKLEGHGLVLVENQDEITLGTSPEVADLIEKIQKEELNKELSKASLETLAVILYKNGATRSEIDYIRGVNSSFILRILTIRGLIERQVDLKDTRRYVYQPSLNLLSYLGIQSINELPNFNEVHNSVQDSLQKIIEELKNETS